MAAGQGQSTLCNGLPDTQEVVMSMRELGPPTRPVVTSQKWGDPPDGNMCFLICKQGAASWLCDGSLVRGLGLEEPLNCCSAGT